MLVSLVFPSPPPPMLMATNLSSKVLASTCFDEALPVASRFPRVREL